MRKTAIITGGAGFIGSHMCDLLHAQNYRLIIVDNLFRGKLENIQHLLDANVGHVFSKIDLTHESCLPEIEGLLREYRPQLIMHYAAVNGTQYFYDQPAFVAETNCQTSYQLVRAMGRCKEFCRNRSCITRQHQKFMENPTFCRHPNQAEHGFVSSKNAIATRLQN